MLVNIASIAAVLISVISLIFSFYQYLDKKRGEKLNISVQVKSVCHFPRDMGYKIDSIFAIFTVNNNSDVPVSINSVEIIGKDASESYQMHTEFAKRLISTLTYKNHDYPVYTDKMPINLDSHIGKTIILEFRCTNKIRWFLYNPSKINVQTNKGIYSFNVKLEEHTVELPNFLRLINVI